MRIYEIRLPILETNMREQNAIDQWHQHVQWLNKQGEEIPAALQALAMNSHNIIDYEMSAPRYEGCEHYMLNRDATQHIMHFDSALPPNNPLEAAHRQLTFLKFLVEFWQIPVDSYSDLRNTLIKTSPNSRENMTWLASTVLALTGHNQWFTDRFLPVQHWVLQAKRTQWPALTDAIKLSAKLAGMKTGWRFQQARWN